MIGVEYLNGCYFSIFSLVGNFRKTIFNKKDVIKSELFNYRRLCLPD